jgi:hypothetical protein
VWFKPMSATRIYKEFTRKIPFPCQILCRHSAMTGAKGVPPMATSNTPPWSPTATMGSILFSCFILSMSYYRLAPRYPSTKQSAWILTTISSAVMTLASIPFLYDYFSNGGSVKYVRMIPNLSVTVSRFFQSYLAMDLTMGAVYYRDQVGLLTGWIHHPMYIMIVELAIRRSWTHIFCLCAAMEVPTFFLGFMGLHPDFRNNTAFAVAFFLTRILFHIILAISYFLHDNRTQTTGGSYLPSLLLTTILPLHVMWFYGCIQGFYRRASQRHSTTPISTIDGVGILPVDRKVSPPPETRSRPTSSSVVDNRHNARSTDSTPSPTFATYDSTKLEHSKLRSRRFYSRTVSLSNNDSRSSVTGKLRTKLYASLPNREVVFDYVGLGRGSAQEQ